MNPNRFRCPACRTRRTSFTSLIKHVRDKGHRLCTCGGYHYAHRPASRFCVENPMSDVWLAMRSGATDAELQEIEMYCVWEKPGRPFTKWIQMTNAFDTKGPSTALKGVRVRSASQLRKDAERKNRESSTGAFIQPEKRKKLEKASI